METEKQASGQERRDGRKMRERAAFVILAAAAAIAICLPARVLFLGDGPYAQHIQLPQTWKMMAETAVWFTLLFICFFRLNGRKIGIFAVIALFMAFCWLHVTFLPMAVSGLYLGYLLLAGRFFREKILHISLPGEFFADFVTGSSLVIVQFCLMSALGIGQIPALKAAALIEGTLLYVWAARMGWQALFSIGPADKTGSRIVRAALCSFLMLMVFIQIGRMNISLDFDTLWYGVRSEYVLNNGKGIYENPGLVGMVYVYSKGLEVLTLPMADLASHAYLQFFNVWLACLGLAAVYKIASFYMSKRNAFLAAVLMSAIPGVMNMSITAKTDIITWLLQLIMVYYLIAFVGAVKDDGLPKSDFIEDRQGNAGESVRPVKCLIFAAAAYMLSLTMKPTSLVFSTAIFGMAGIYLIASRRLAFRAPVRQWIGLIPAGAALASVWARTMLITGMPVTSVFTSILARLGFEMKYPFATGSLPQNWQDESNLHVLLRRLYQMLLAPEGKDMSHVVIAWGTSLLFFLLVCLAAFSLLGGSVRGEKKNEKTKRKPLSVFAHTVFWPFLIVNMVSLVMLYQVDGNYFMLLYTVFSLAFCAALETVSKQVKTVSSWLLVPLLAFNMFLTAETNWAWSVGFSDLKLFNKGRINHEALRQEDMIRKGNAQIWQILAADPRTRVIAFGEHPFCLEFPCLVQSYKDITAPWGNVELVNTAENFEQYMAYAKTDYVYVEAGHIGEDSWSWSYGLLKEMIVRGAVTEPFFEDGNALFRVNALPLSGSQAEEEGKENLRLFEAHYRTAGP